MSSYAGLGEVSIIVPAAGRGTRMEHSAGTRKQYLPVNAKPLLEHTLSRLTRLGARQVVLVVGADDDEYTKVPGHERCQVVIGGDTRAASVRNAMNALAVLDDDWVMVHDGARPCVRAEEIHHLAEEVMQDAASVGGLLAVPAVDTIKEVRDGVVARTLDRDNLWLAQTPQMFRFGVLSRALEKALADDAAVTDEASAVEALGLAPRIVRGRTDNIKVTSVSDLALAEFYLSQQDES